MEAPPNIVVEFFGTARARAGRAELPLPASCVASALNEIARQCPRLTSLVAGGRLSSHYLVSINGGPFVTDLDVPLTAGDRVLVLATDAGG